MQRQRSLLILILVLVIAAITVIAKIPPFGIRLQGGSQLTIQVKPSEEIFIKEITDESGGSVI